MLTRSTCRIAASFALATAALAAPAFADAPAYIESHFVASPTNPNALTYDFWVRNPGPATTVTVVWKSGTRVVGRQQLPVGTQPRWHSWSHRLRHGSEPSLTVELTAADGSVIHTDTWSPGAAAAPATP